FSSLFHQPSCFYCILFFHHRALSSIDDMKILKHIGTDKNWQERKDIVLKNVYSNMTKLISEAKDKTIYKSLAVFKPTEILDFTWEEVARKWDSERLANLESQRRQLKLFEKSENLLKVFPKLPYKFSYKFLDNSGKESTLMIEDWETGQLYLRYLKIHKKNEALACAEVKKQYFDNFAKTKDLYFFMGTTREHHLISKNPFIIIGVFYPPLPNHSPQPEQLKLF
ncbi:MAG: hypothetical protein SFH39_03265, partial [Candidatus Magnetobacterium sp. LHC-1]